MDEDSIRYYIKYLTECLTNILLKLKLDLISSI